MCQTKNTKSGGYFGVKRLNAQGKTWDGVSEGGTAPNDKESVH